MDLITKTKRTTVTRTPARACYDRKNLNEIIDEAIVGHLAFTDDVSIHSIPMAFWRDEEDLFCHCSVNSRLVNLTKQDQDVCISFAIFDGLVLAKSAFRHSINYRSVVVYGQFELVQADPEKLRIMKKFMDLFDPKRWELVRTPNQEELNAIAVLKIPLTEAAVKIRKGPPNDKKMDLNRDVWAGVIPRMYSYGEPEPN